MWYLTVAYVLGGILSIIGGAVALYKFEIVKEIFVGGIKKLFNWKDKAQSIEVTINQHLSVGDVKEIVDAVFELNILKLKNEALQTAHNRANWFNNNVLNSNLTPNQLSKFREPGIQNSLFNAQYAFAKSGDEHLGDLLGDLLKKRLDVESRSYDQILYDEAILIVPKLTNFHLDVLALTYLVREVPKYMFADVTEFRTYLTQCFLPLIDNVDPTLSVDEIKDQFGLHLISLGCGERSRANVFAHFLSYFKGYCQEVITNGFSLEEYKNITRGNKGLEELIIPCLLHPDKYQLSSQKALREFRANHKELDKENSLLFELAHKSRFSKDEELLAIIPEIAKIQSALKGILITDLLPLGTLIAKSHINAKIKQRSVTR